MKTNYERQAQDFLNAVGATIKIEYKRSGKHFDSDTEDRDIYSVLILRGNRSYLFDFGQSLNDSGFYVKIGKNKYPLRSEWLKAKDLAFKIKYLINSGYTSSIDTIHYPKAPTPYSILACLTKYDPGTFEDFCSEFGYDTDSKKAEKTYNAVKEEYLNVCSLFSDAELEQLQEIQ